ncbi:Uncharacterized protein SCF082_LOCUS29860, partial [Durusdinium trenchii]
CLEFAVHLTPQYGDSFLELLRLRFLLELRAWICAEPLIIGLEPGGWDARRPAALSLVLHRILRQAAAALRSRCTMHPAAAILEASWDHHVGVTVAGVLSKIQPAERREGVKKIVQIFKKHTKDLKIWGENIIGAGKLWYQSKSQKPYTWFQCGVVARSSAISVYLSTAQLTSAMVTKIGPKCKHGVGCLYIKSLADVNMKELEQVVKKGFSVTGH